MESTRHIPWLRILIEGVVVVGSILLAFGIDAWWDGRQERARRAALVRDLADEFSLLGQELRVSLDDAEDLEGRTLALLDASARRVRLSPDSIQSLALGVVRGAVQPPITPRYDAAIASGDIELVSRDDVLDALTMFDVARVRYAKIYDMVAENFFLGTLADLRREIVSLSLLNPLGGRSEPPVRFSPQDLNELLQRPSVYSAIEAVHVLRVNLRANLGDLVVTSDSVSSVLEGLSPP